MRRILAAAVVLSLGPWAPALVPAAGTAGDSSYVAQITSWRASREARLRSATGWLTVAGFFWLEPGANPVGSEPGSTVLLPADASPPRVGILHLMNTPAGPEFVLEAMSGSGLQRDSLEVTREVFRLGEDGDSPIFTLGRLSFWVIPRADRYAVRLRDPEYPLRRDFRGIDAYPIDPALRVIGRLEPLPAPAQVPVPNMMGWVDTMLTPGPVVFALGDRILRLVPLLESPADSEYFFVFQDATSGIETYGAGRFLYSPVSPDGAVVLDFNKAYNPPCAFNPNTTCPLPPEGNTLPVAIRAGEKAYLGDH